VFYLSLEKQQPLRSGENPASGRRSLYSLGQNSNGIGRRPNSFQGKELSLQQLCGIWKRARSIAAEFQKPAASSSSTTILAERRNSKLCAKRTMLRTIVAFGGGAAFQSRSDAVTAEEVANFVECIALCFDAVRKKFLPPKRICGARASTGGLEPERDCN